MWSADDDEVVGESRSNMANLFDTRKDSGAGQTSFEYQRPTAPSSRAKKPSKRSATEEPPGPVLTHATIQLHQYDGGKQNYVAIGQSVICLLGSKSRGYQLWLYQDKSNPISRSRITATVSWTFQQDNGKLFVSYRDVQDQLFSIGWPNEESATDFSRFLLVARAFASGAEPTLVSQELREIPRIKPPTDGSTVAIQYSLWLETGALIEKQSTSVDVGDGSGSSAPFFIPGWDHAVRGMRKGTRRMTVVPPHLAYGAKGDPARNIPGNTALIFLVDLISTQRKKSAAPPSPAPVSSSRGGRGGAGSDDEDEDRKSVLKDRMKKLGGQSYGGSDPSTSFPGAFQQSPPPQQFPPAGPLGGFPGQQQPNGFPGSTIGGPPGGYPGQHPYQQPAGGFPGQPQQPPSPYSGGALALYNPAAAAPSPYPAFPGQAPQQQPPYSPYGQSQHPPAPGQPGGFPAQPGYPGQPAPYPADPYAASAAYPPPPPPAPAPVAAPAAAATPSTATADIDRGTKQTVLQTGKDVEELKEFIPETREFHKDMRVRINTVCTKIDAMYRKYDEAIENTSGKNARSLTAHELITTIQRMVEEIDRLKEDLRVKTNSVEQQRDKIAQLHGDIERLYEQNQNNLEQKNRSMSATSDSAQQQMIRLQAEKAKGEAELQEAIIEKQNALLQTQKLKISYDALVQELRVVNQAVEEAKNELNEAKEETTNANESIRDLESRLKRERSQNESSSSLISALQNDLQEAQTKITTMEATMREAKRKFEQVFKESEQANEEEKSSLIQKISQLQRAVQSDRMKMQERLDSEVARIEQEAEEKWREKLVSYGDRITNSLKQELSEAHTLETREATNQAVAAAVRETTERLQKEHQQELQALQLQREKDVRNALAQGENQGVQKALAEQQEETRRALEQAAKTQQSAVAAAYERGKIDGYQSLRDQMGDPNAAAEAQARAQVQINQLAQNVAQLSADRDTLSANQQQAVLERDEALRQLHEAKRIITENNAATSLAESSERTIESIKEIMNGVYYELEPDFTNADLYRGSDIKRSLLASIKHETFRIVAELQGQPAPPPISAAAKPVPVDLPTSAPIVQEHLQPESFAIQDVQPSPAPVSPAIQRVSVSETRPVVDVQPPVETFVDPDDELIGNEMPDFAPAADISAAGLIDTPPSFGVGNFSNAGPHNGDEDLSEEEEPEPEPHTQDNFERVVESEPEPVAQPVAHKHHHEHHDDDHEHHEHHDDDHEHHEHELDAGFESEPAVQIDHGFVPHVDPIPEPEPEPEREQEPEPEPEREQEPEPEPEPEQKPQPEPIVSKAPGFSSALFDNPLASNDDGLFADEEHPVVPSAAPIPQAAAERLSSLFGDDPLLSAPPTASPVKPTAAADRLNSLFGGDDEADLFAMPAAKPSTLSASLFDDDDEFSMAAPTSTRTTDPFKASADVDDLFNF